MVPIVGRDGRYTVRVLARRCGHDDFPSVDSARIEPESSCDSSGIRDLLARAHLAAMLRGLRRDHRFGVIRRSTPDLYTPYLYKDD
jgi:hypothetical protein